METFPGHAHVIGFTGEPGGGKTWFTERLRRAAGIDVAEALVECSTPIVPLAEKYRQFLLWYLFDHGLDMPIAGLTNPTRIIRYILKEAHTWLSDVSDNLIPEVPPDAFDGIDHLEAAKIAVLEREIVRSTNLVLHNRKDYASSITVKNKSTKAIRPLLTAINMLVSELACYWLRTNSHPRVKNLWPFLAMRRLERVHTEHPDWPLLIINGLRMPGDDAEVHALGGLVLARRFPSAETEHSHSVLPTEQPGNVVPDYIIYGDCRVDDEVDELMQVAEHVWWLIEEGLLEAGHGESRILDVDFLLACDGSHVDCYQAA